MEIKTEPTWDEVWDMICDVESMSRIRLFKHLHQIMGSRDYFQDYFQKSDKNKKWELYNLIKNWK